MVIFSNEAGSISYSTEGELGALWELQLQQRKLPYSYLKYNHHMGWPSDYSKVAEYWDNTVLLASSLGVNLPESPDQAALNAAHNIFAGPRLDNISYRDVWLELNTAIHWHEHHLQNRGPVTAIDFNPAGWVGIKLPDGITPDYEIDGGLYLLYAQIGRWWGEIWRANDMLIPRYQHKSQTVWNASCYLVNYRPVNNYAHELAMWESRSNWGCTWENRQKGRYKIGTRITPVPSNWNLFPVRKYTIVKG